MGKTTRGTIWANDAIQLLPELTRRDRGADDDLEARMRRLIASVLAESARRRDVSARELRIIRIVLRVLGALYAMA